MKICVDENIRQITVLELQQLGHDVLDIRGTEDQGIRTSFYGRKHKEKEDS